MKKSLLIISILVVSGIFLAGCLDSKSTTASDKCAPAFYDSSPNSNVTAGLTTLSDSVTFVTKDTYTVDEIAEMQYGFEVNETEEGLYIVYELCYEDEDKPDDPLELVEDDWNYYVNTMMEDYGYQGNSAGGNKTAFVYESEGEEMNSAGKPGNYAVYVLASEGDGEWTIADSFKFEVRE